MRIVAAFLIVALVIAGIIGFMGAALPVSHSVTRTVDLPAPPERVYNVISNVSVEQKWRSSIKSVTVGQTPDGKMLWTEHTSMGDFPLELIEDNAPIHRVVRIADPKIPFQGDWVYDLGPKNGGTELTITENGVVRNPYFRFMNRYVFGYYKTMDEYIADLQRELSLPVQQQQ